MFNILSNWTSSSFPLSNAISSESPNVSFCQTFLQSSQQLCVHSARDTPFYYSPAPQLFESLNDSTLALATPIVAYWISSMFFHALDCFPDSPYLNKYRIHPSEEVARRNRVGKLHVIGMVIFQQILQTALGLVLLDDGKSVSVEAALGGVLGWAETLNGLVDSYMVWLDEEQKIRVLLNAGYLMYWWIVPLAQFFFAMFILDSWQYFLHRLFHTSTFLFKRFHSYHHRLYVPYAFGALYNHPLEGFVLDSLGALVAENCSFMTARQAALLFLITCFKTVDDHCGYSLPWDILQWFTANNADYHDIHHQNIGFKFNYSQPFFIHWDVILGTRMTREDILRKKAKANGNGGANGHVKTD